MPQILLKGADVSIPLDLPSDVKPERAMAGIRKLLDESWRESLSPSDLRFLEEMKRADLAREEMKREAEKLPEGKKRGWIGS